MTNQASIATLLDIIRERRTFVITSHLRPDGDALGSALGLMHLLEAMGKHVVVNFTEPVPALFQFLPGADRIDCQYPAVQPDAIVFLECDSVQRSSLSSPGLETWQKTFTINIDHHQTGLEFASFNWIDPEAASVGSMVYDLALAAGMSITKAMADCLYSAVLTDTGSFNYPSTSAATFAMAEHLVQVGTVPNLIARSIYFCNPLSKVQLLGIALTKLRVEDQVCWSTVTIDEMKSVGATVEDCEGIANYLVAIAGIEAAVFVRELPSREHCRLSIRGRGNFDVSQVAVHFGGGGHFSASGCSAHGILEDVTARAVAELKALCKLPRQGPVNAAVTAEECSRLLA
jgi:phosphoesterase RecJ-like protein